MKNFTRTIGKQCFPTEDIIKQHSLTLAEIESFSEITCAMCAYGDYSLSLIYPINLEDAKKEVLEIVLSARATNDESRKQRHPLFRDMYTLYLKGSIESIESNSASLSFQLAELHRKKINSDIKIEDYTEKTKELKIENLLNEIGDKAYSLHLVTEDVLIEIVELAENKEYAYYHDRIMKLNLLIENLAQLKELLTRKKDAAEIMDVIKIHEEENLRIMARIEILKVKMMAA